MAASRDALLLENHERVSGKTVKTLATIASKASKPPTILQIFHFFDIEHRQRFYLGSDVLPRTYRKRTTLVYVLRHS